MMMYRVLSSGKRGNIVDHGNNLPLIINYRSVLSRQDKFIIFRWDKGSEEYAYLRRVKK